MASENKKEDTAGVSMFDWTNIDAISAAADVAW